MFHLCSPLDDADLLIAAIQQHLGNLATHNYPYQIGNLPAYPVNASCQLVGAKEGIEALREVVSLVWTNTTCTALLNHPWLYSPGFIPGAWTFQRCSEIVLPSAVAPSNGMFLPCNDFKWNCFQLTDFSDFCAAAVKGRVVLNATRLSYGSPQIQSQRAANRVVYTNGDLDPWSYGGFAPASNSIWMDGAAHHLDLRAPNILDPRSVTQARIAVTAFLKNVSDSISIF
jgi:hypothetical protein